MCVKWKFVLNMVEINCENYNYEDRLGYIDLPTFKMRRMRDDLIQTYDNCALPAMYKGDML